VALRCGFDRQRCRLWRENVHHGLCTMNPSLTKWCCEFCRRAIDTHGDNRLNPEMPCSLPAVAWTLVPPCQELRAKTHDACIDSRVGWLIAKQLHSIIRNPTDVDQ